MAKLLNELSLSVFLTAVIYKLVPQLNVNFTCKIELTTLKVLHGYHTCVSFF